MYSDKQHVKDPYISLQPILIRKLALTILIMPLITPILLITKIGKTATNNQGNLGATQHGATSNLNPTRL
jgi:hypothetical protein